MRINPKESLQQPEVSFSNTALNQIYNLSNTEQLIVSKGIARSLGKALRMYLRVSVCSFISLDESKILTTLSNDTVTFSVDGYAVRVQICNVTYNWHVVSIGLPGSLKTYDIKKLE